MRPFEIALVLVLFTCSIYLLTPTRSEVIWFRWLAFATVLLCVVHLYLEGARWQMGPAYLLVLAVVVIACTTMKLPAWSSYAAGIAASGLMCAAVALGTFLPVFSLPSPAGPYRIGTQTRYLVDRGRQEPFDRSASRPRELAIQIWYPADPTARGPVAPYREPAITTIRNARFSLVRTHGVVDAPFERSSERHPVLVYSPSWVGIRSENTILIEHLVSHGYVVVAIDHPYGSALTAFPDGRRVETKLTDLDAYASVQSFANFIDIATTQLKVRADDARFVLETLEHLNADDPKGLLTGRLDLQRVGIFGFSFGGGVALQACWLDPRFKAGVDIDGMILAESAKEGAASPFLFILSDAEPRTDDPDVRTRNEAIFDELQLKQMKQLVSERHAQLLTMPGALHNNFNDAPFYSPLPIGSETAALDAYATAATLGRYVLAFFDRSLKQVHDPASEELFGRRSVP
jgi:predicted dienelactone hydrolase